LYANGTTVASGRYNDPKYIHVGAGQETTAKILMARELGKVKTVVISTVFEQATLRVFVESSCWVTEADVTRITFTGTQTGGLGIGTRVQIFKVSS